MTAEDERSVHERETARKIRLARAASLPPGTANDAANEDFLFHLYRGSELLQDNRVHEAKTELEYALTLQPSDPKGQDLLALVYFRIGHYPRAIQIYEELLRDNPDEPALKLNLALSYLKTGHADAARNALEDVVQGHPDHRRAWGYLGLAYQRLGDYDKAQQAFDRGGHTTMSKRMSSRAAAMPPAAAPSRPGKEIRAAAALAFEELDSGELSFSLAEPETQAAEGGTWYATEPGATLPPSPSGVPRGRHPTLEWGLAGSPSSAPAALQAEPTPRRPSEPAPASSLPRSVGELARSARLPFPHEGAVALLRNGLVVVRTHAGGAESGFATRLEAVRSYSGSMTTTILQRVARGQALQDTFGGVATPMVGVGGDAQLVLGPRPSHTIVGFALRDDVAFVCEELLLGFEMRLAFENGRLATGDDQHQSMVQLSGAGVVLLELADALASLDVTASRPVHVRREVLVGWVGRLVPRALPLGESPAGQRGLLSLSGDGAILLAAK